MQRRKRGCVFQLLHDRFVDQAALFYEFSLERQVPADHLLRTIDRFVVLNNLDRYQLALDAIRRIPRFADQVEKATARYWTSMERHKLYISEHGDDLPEIRDWRWSA